MVIAKENHSYKVLSVCFEKEPLNGYGNDYAGVNSSSS